jgi:hypothetical protein
MNFRMNAPALWLTVFCLIAVTALIHRPYVHAQSGLTASGSRSTGIYCGGTGDSAVVQSAAGSSGVTVEFPLGSTCIIDASVTVSGNNIVWHGNGATLKRLSSTSDTTHYGLNITGSNFQMDGFTLDIGGVTAGPDGSHDFLVFAGGSAKFTNITIQNSGTSQPNMSGILGFQANLEVSRSTCASTVLGYCVLHDSGSSATTVSLHDNVDTGTTLDAFFVENGTAATLTTISNNQCYTITSASGTGANGNCVVVFQRLGGTSVSGNLCYSLTYSCIRVNNSTGVVVSGNRCDTSAENCFYTSELGGEGATVSGNICANSAFCASDTNIASRTIGVPGNFTGNTAYNIRGYCYHIENATATGNTCASAPVGFEVGFSGVGFGNLVSNNIFSHVTIPIVVDKSLTNTPNNIVGLVAFQNANSGSQTNNVQAMDLPTVLTITGATNASAMVLTTSSSLPSAGQVYLLESFYGMTGANTGGLCTVASPSGSTFTCTALNSTGFGTFSNSPATNIPAVAHLLYSSGTTPAFSIPSVVQQLTIP